jgi:hypothetical protein
MKTGALCLRLARAAYVTMRSSTLPSQYMNALIVGANKTPILDHVDSSHFLLIDDGPLIDALVIPPRRKVVHFDIKKHHLNPLHEMDYRRAREFISILDAVFPEGDSTLTKKNANFVLLNALLEEPTRLDKLLRGDKRDPAKQDAYQKIETILLSPVLRLVLCEPTNFSMKGIVLARLDRAVLGDFDAFVLANLLISQFEGQVIIPDFGFYGREHHISLIRQERLVAGVNTLSELPLRLQQALLTVPDKIASRTTSEDAEILAKYRGFVRHTIEHSDFVHEAMCG